MDSKYINLPGIAHGEPDFYESSDLPEAEQTVFTPQGVDSSSSVEVIPVDVKHCLETFGKAKLDATNADFSDQILPRKHRGYDQRHGDWGFSPRTDETVVEKFRRLKCEFQELVDELEKTKDADGGKGGDAALVGQLLPEAEDLRDALNRMSLERVLGKEKFQEVVDGEGTAKKKLAVALDALKKQPQPAGGTGAGTSSEKGVLSCELFHLPEQEKFERMKRMCELDERVAALEKMLGKPGAVATNPLNAEVSGLPLTSAVKILASKLSLLEPAKMDMLEARAHGLLHKVHELSDRSASGAGGGEKTSAKVNELYSLLKSSEGARSVLPDVVERLVALKSVHDQAANCLKTVSEMDSVQKEIQSQIATENSRLDQLESTIAKNVDTMATNLAKMEQRLQALKK